jgi:hypothetical protein
MKLVVSITHMDGVLYATYTGGKCTIQEILYHTQNTVNAAKRHQCDRVLIVVNIVESLGVSFQHLASVARILGALPQGTQVAYNRHDVEYQPGSEPSVTTLRYRFLRGATRVHGVEVRAFESIHDAREWLGLTATDTAREKQELQAAHAVQANTLRQARDRRRGLIAQAKQTP